MTTGITIQSEGRRHYLVGDTYPIRSAIRIAGCKWDRDRGAWWTGKREIAESLVSSVAAGSVQAECSWRKVGADFLVAIPAGMTAKAGDTVTVRASSGSSKQVVLAAEVQPGLFAIVREPRAQGSSRRFGGRRGGGGGGRCRGCGGPVVDCSHHRAMGGYCGSCAFDEFDC